MKIAEDLFTDKNKRKGDLKIMILEQIRKQLEDNRLFADDIRLYDDTVEIDISWGDWKHEHLRCDLLMKELGCENWGKVTTEEDGSDCYSATHIYKLPCMWRVQ